MIFKLRRGTIDLGGVVIQMLMSSGRRGQPAARLNIWTRVPQGRGRSLQDAAALVAPRGRVRSTDCLINSRKIPAERRSGRCSVSVEASRTAGEAAAAAVSCTVRRNSSSSLPSFGFHSMHPSVKAAGDALVPGSVLGF